MNILLMGEYSGVHCNLAKGLRAIGHTVTVASNGDFWKDYPRDIDLKRSLSPAGALRFAATLAHTLPKLRDYDVVQLINPMFLELKAGRIFNIYDYLRRHNGHIVLCAFGMDYYWVHTCVKDMPLRYSDFNIGDELRTNDDATNARAGWTGTDKERLNKYIAQDCDAIVAGLYEYYVCYKKAFPKKTTFIPYPIRMTAEENAEVNAAIKQEQRKLACRLPGGSAPDEISAASSAAPKAEARDATTTLPGSAGKIRIFIGINVTRDEYKGTDIMLRAARDVAKEYPGRVELIEARSVPYDEYSRMMGSADVLLDQLYSYTPAMNALLAMSKGIVCVGGGEPENYEILGEKELRPIINVLPTYESVRGEIERLVTRPERLPELKRQSIEYIRRHHDYIKVARQYEELYKSF